MIRNMIKIDEERCNGCGACVSACHEGAIRMVDGKAKLTREDYCDGLGDCLPACPVGAITFEEREAPAYDAAAVLEAKGKRGANPMASEPAAMRAGGCPGMRSVDMRREGVSDSQLSQWPVQIKLAPVNAPYFAGARLLIAADCTAYAYGRFHTDFIRGHITLIGCPKLDEGDYGEKLARIIAGNDIESVQVIRMEVPCCGGIENAVKRALKAAGKSIPWSVVTISADGRIVDRRAEGAGSKC